MNKICDLRDILSGVEIFKHNDRTWEVHHNVTLKEANLMLSILNEDTGDIIYRIQDDVYVKQHYADIRPVRHKIADVSPTLYSFKMLFTPVRPPEDDSDMETGWSLGTEGRAFIGDVTMNIKAPKLDVRTKEETDKPNKQARLQEARIMVVGASMQLTNALEDEDWYEALKWQGFITAGIELLDELTNDE